MRLRLCFIALTVVAFVAFAGFALGCQGLADLTAGAIGAPTSKEVEADAAALRGAEERSDLLEGQVAAMQRELDRLQLASTNVAERHAGLVRVQSELIAQIATAKPEERDGIIASLREVDRQVASIETERSTITGLQSRADQELAALRAAGEAAKRDLLEAEARLDSVPERTQAAILRASEGAKQGGALASSFGVPGAGAVGVQVGEALDGALNWILGGSTLGTTLYALYARRQRNGARRVIANTEHYGLTEIATNEQTRNRAQLTLALDPVAAAEFRAGKALAA